MEMGQIIKTRLENQGQSVTWFCKKINCSRSKCYDLFKSNSIDTILLKEICEVLNYNFFKDLSAEIETQMFEK
ncbi:MAG: XRE family transcriptional regulator [Bacteroidales bacterium]|nr:XRE family transcriptional regulator [Bacteroidales bacterium]